MTPAAARRPARPWVIAHRGASRDFPENTLGAFEEALAQGADGIELDVQLSRDGAPVVYHDRTLARAGGGRRAVRQLDLADLVRLDPGARLDSRFRGLHIPSLEEVLERYGARTRLLIEIKTREGRAGGERHRQLARAVAGQLARRRLASRAMVLSFDPVVLEQCRESVPALPRVLNLRPPARPPQSLRQRLAGLSALSVDVRTLTPAFAAAVARTGTALLVYTCNRPGQVARAVAAGARGVMSDRPGWLARALDRD